jgi:CDP-diacylglycerol--glycerol-3-phosphate 3-phosphatidyltransferase
LPSLRRLIGLDRSGPPPPDTRRGQPLRPWTLPNAIGFTRLALVPTFLVLALSSDDGRTAAATVLFSVAAGSDYLDGLVARLTGQYSRLGTLLDPFVDRLVIVSGVAVAWKFELLPRWGLAVLALRELLVLAVTQVGLRRGLDIEINWVGRWAVWPTMFSIWLAMVSVTWVADAFFFAGLALTLAATVLYVRDFGRALARPSTSS